MHRWVKSSYSGGLENACVEWCPTHAHERGTVPVRDSKNPSGPALTFEPAAWNAFITSIKAGHFQG
ncbi:DUF397 domain-containing protein [Streptomyces zagrosensis]|uniref:Fe-S-cluster-containing dehydrogenase component n=1 Tax=Streptomyces zagrosensis TaxID=1042984 RepID=A0A7W9QFF2_9ACTN|nr:DUF397 domain-containing protein [Streptomyces zagrosensis]MBB5938217.1 Fe-S-cluster-containing dehydrogenase component [Streptomyces zagrosensis]